MANIKADEISKILREQIANYEQTVSVDESAQSSASATASRAFTVSKRSWPARCCVPHNVFGLALNLEEEEVARCCWRVVGVEGRRRREAHEHDHVRAVDRN